MSTSYCDYVSARPSSTIHILGEFQQKFCRRCQAKYAGTRTQKYCPTCGEIRRVERDRKASAKRRGR